MYCVFGKMILVNILFVLELVEYYLKFFKVVIYLNLILGLVIEYNVLGFDCNG